MVEHPAEYRWSSYRVNAQGEADNLVQSHPLYTTLGGDTGSRQAAYRELFRYELEPGMVDEIRRATNGNFALGNERFAAQVAEMIGRRATPGQSGRPRKSVVLSQKNCFFELKPWSVPGLPIVLSLGLIVVVLNGSGPLGAMVYLPFISIYAGLTAFIGWDPVNALVRKLEKAFSIKHSHTDHGDLLAH